LPGCLNAGPFRLKSGDFQEGNHIDVEDRIVIQNGVAIGSRFRKGFAQLLHDPIGRWMPCNVEVRDPAALVLDDEETVPHSKSRTRYGKEIEGDNGLAVVVKKREPFLGRITPAMEAPQIARDGPLGEPKPSFCNSPWILGAPQSEFSCAQRRISTRISGVIAGRHAAEISNANTSGNQPDAN
jgi:hypothetical protein